MKEGNMPRIAVLAVVLALMISACGISNQQKTAITDFGAATSTTGSLCAEAFSDIRSEVIDMNVLITTLNPKISRKEIDFDGFADVDDTKVRIAAASALSTYGQLLVELVSDESSGDAWKNTSRVLVENISQVSGGAADESRDDVLSQLITELGNIVLDVKRKEALERVIPAAHDAVDRLSRMLAEDLTLGNGGGGYLQGYKSTAGRLENLAIGVIDYPDSFSISERKIAVEGYQMAKCASLKADELSASMNAVIENLQAANNSLLSVITEKNYDKKDIEKFAGQVRVVADAWKYMVK
jgi:hypothetical protein